MDVEAMLQHAGAYGPYQLLLLTLYAYINVLSAFHYFGQTFISLVPEHRCRLPEEGEAPPRSPEPACTQYSPSPSLSPSPSQNWTLEACSRGWVYNYSHGYHTIVSELDWVCEDDWKVATGQSTFFIGSVLGTLLLGILSDTYGRLPVLVLANLFAMVGNLATAFVTNLWQFSLVRFIAGFATDSNFFMMYIIVMEYLSPGLRTLGLNLTIGLFYTLGLTSLPWLAIHLGTWRRLMLVVGGIHSVVVGYALVVPESARWLLQRGRIKEAVKCFERVARFNGRTLEPSYVGGFEEAARSSVVPETSSSIIGLFRTPRLRRNTCILIFKSMVLTLCYDAISRNISGLGFDPFVLFTLSSATVLPSCALILCLQDCAGRKAVASASLMVTGLFTAAAGLVLCATGADARLAAVLSVIGRVGVNVAYNSGVQYAAELIPTEVRGQGVAIMHVVGYGATFFSPYILYLAEQWAAFPHLVLGGLATAGAVLCLFLPETLHRQLPVSLQDGEAFGSGERVCEFACCARPVTSVDSVTSVATDTTDCDKAKY